jgi:tetratricopeptide (TPR) repeat protein
MVLCRSRASWNGLLGAVAAVLAGCAHQTPPAPAGPSRQFQSEAAHIGRVVYEDDFQEARLVFQALPVGVPERAALREHLLRYLLEPVLALRSGDLRREARDLESDDVYDRVFESFRDALGFFDPSELWSSPPAVSKTERALLEPAAQLVTELFSPRGADQQVALAAATLATLDAGNNEWPGELDQIIRWTDEASSAASEGGGIRRTQSAVDVLEGALADWPAPPVVKRLDALYGDRQKKFASVLRHPVGGGESARRALGELLLAHGDEMQRAVVNIATIYLRAGRIDLAARRAAELGGDAGDDPDLRGLLDAAAQPNAAGAAYLALARRFLPRMDPLGGTASDTPDPLVAFRVLEAGVARSPGDPELLILSAHVARMLSSYFLAIRRLEEAQALLDRDPAGHELEAKVSAELLELYFLRLRLRLDPEREPPAFGEADVLRARFAETRRRFQGADMKVHDADIDFELARSYVNVGDIDRAEPLFLRAREEGEPTAEVTTELASLALKRGDPRRATQILRDGLDSLRAKGTEHDTIGSVEGRSRLERQLGDAYDVAGDHDNAEVSWRGALIGWERLMIEHLRRKSFTASAEATLEVGRLLYLLGRHGEALQKFDEALEQDSDRDQSYIDMIAFLVQNGETDAAVSIHRRALARPTRAVSEYVKVYTSLWILDLTRRTSKTADPAAESYLRSLDQRHGDLRPHRGATWYRQLARYAVGKVTYDQAMASADTPGKRAEIYFYEAMHRLADGRADDAHQLWQKVVDTRMFSFFEFEMASRYLRLGAPSAPSGQRVTTETI